MYLCMLVLGLYIGFARPPPPPPRLPFDSALVVRSAGYLEYRWRVVAGPGQPKAASSNPEAVRVSGLRFIGV